MEVVMWAASAAADDFCLFVVVCGNEISRRKFNPISLMVVRAIM